MARIRAIVDAHPRAVLGGAFGTVFALAAVCALLLGVAVGGAETAPPQSAGEEQPAPAAIERAQPGNIPPARVLRTCSIASFADDARLGSFRASISDALSGEVLFSRNGSKPAAQASVTKLFTAAAALGTLGPERTLSTRVFEGTQPGSIVLVGGGDPTLTRVTSGESFYPGAPKLSDLAAQTVAAYSAAHPGEQIATVVLDASMWDPADNWLPSWNDNNRSLGYQSRVTALQVDGDRDDPLERVSPRSDNPVQRAGDAFAQAIADASGAAAPATEVGIVSSTQLLAEVESQPVSRLVGQMLTASDGALAEALARVTSVELEAKGTSASIASVVPGALDALGLDVTTVNVVDGSGLSADNTIAPAAVARLLAKAREGNNDLKYIYNALAVAGESGGLKDRFTGGSEIARSKVFAKVGQIEGVRSLAGIIEAADGSLLAFSFVAAGDGVNDSAFEALDAVAAGAFTCGQRLAPV